MHGVFPDGRLGNPARTGHAARMTAVRIGFCSFADEALTKLWYPPGSNLDKP